MKKLLLAFLLTSLIAGCGVFGDDASDRFGAWEKVSSDLGEYRGIDGPSKIAPVSGSSSADTIQIDTSFVSSDEQLNISISNNDLTDDRDYDLYLQLVDSNASHQMKHWDIQYVSDSTAFDAMLNDARLRASGVLEVGVILEYNCDSQQADQEFLNIAYADEDSTNATFYQIQADGMLSLVDDILNGCKS